MRKESKILFISNLTVKQLSKIDQAKIKGGGPEDITMGCPPPIDNKPD